MKFMGESAFSSWLVHLLEITNRRLSLFFLSEVLAKPNHMVADGVGFYVVL
jgi:hypothetical protein